MKKIAILLIVTAIFSSCDKIANNTSKKEELGIEEFNDININDLYTIKIPKYMKEMKSLHEEASLKYANIFKETYTIVLDEDKQEFIDAFLSYEMYDETKTPLENYEEIQSNNFRESIDEAEIILIGKKNINNRTAKQYLVKGKVDGIKIEYIITYIEGDKNMYLLMSWTLDYRMKKYIDTFKFTHNSFKLL